MKFLKRTIRLYGRSIEVVLDGRILYSGRSGSEAVPLSAVSRSKTREDAATIGSASTSDSLNVNGKTPIVKS